MSPPPTEMIEPAIDARNAIDDPIAARAVAAELVGSPDGQARFYNHDQRAIALGPHTGQLTL